MRLKVIACEILFRELSFLAAKSPNVIDVTFLPKGLHDVGCERMRSALNVAVESVEEQRYDAIVLGYALCNGGVVGIKAGAIPIVIPRAHDCITLFLGDKDKYLEFFYSHPGTYFQTVGWLERGGDITQIGLTENISEKSVTIPFLNCSYDELVAKYGTANAEYLWSELKQMRHYSQMVFIETGIEPGDNFELQTKRNAEERGWQFEKITGNLDLLRRLLDGNWDDGDFLVLQPGESICFSYDDSIIAAR
ncbi:MAG: DUF1638 domain-containing protein [Planctomycetaceae bacterium]|jgi:hypothetical protein|nr:DUF1638 domain-containing protein [Planctomycetaceae bacterium]